MVAVVDVRIGLIVVAVHIIVFEYGQIVGIGIDLAILVKIESTLFELVEISCIVVVVVVVGC